MTVEDIDKHENSQSIIKGDKVSGIFGRKYSNTGN